MRGFGVEDEDKRTCAVGGREGLRWRSGFLRCAAHGELIANKAIDGALANLRDQERL